MIILIQQGDEGRGRVLPPAERGPKQVLELRRETGLGGGQVAGEVALGHEPRRNGNTVRDTDVWASLVFPRTHPEAVRWRQGQRADRGSGANQNSSGGQGDPPFVISLFHCYLFIYFAFLDGFMRKHLNYSYSTFSVSWT